MKIRFALMAAAALLAACDASHIVRMDVSPVGNTHGSFPVAMQLVATQFQLHPHDNAKAEEVSYSREWGSVREGHPDSLYLTATPSDAPDVWKLEIFEWLVPQQSAFGAQLQAGTISVLERDGYVVRVK